METFPYKLRHVKFVTKQKCLKNIKIETDHDLYAWVHQAYVLQCKHIFQFKNYSKQLINSMFEAGVISDYSVSEFKLEPSCL